MRGLKSIGYVQVEDYFPTLPREPRHFSTKGEPTTSDSILNRSVFVGLSLAGLILALSFSGPFLSK